jgi:cytochrome c oxidase subunit 3
MTVVKSHAGPEALYPLRNGRLAILIFLSTELMFFSALLGSYLVLRFSRLEEWPSQGDVHLGFWFGVANTILLTISTWTLCAAIRGTKQNSGSTARFWLAVTIGLGSAFLAVKGYEYWQKIERGIHPGPGSLVFDAADELYLSSAVKKMRQEIERAELREARAPNRQDDEAWLADLYLIQAGIVDWTQFEVARSANLSDRRTAIECLARMIFPRRNSQRFEDYLRSQAEKIGTEAAQVAARLTESNSQLARLQSEIKRLLPLRENGTAEIRQQFSQVSDQAEQLTQAIAIIQKELKPIQQRSIALTRLDWERGINEGYGLRLPIVLPGGKIWSGTYYLLTGFHAVHLLAGLVVLCCCFGMRLDSSRTGWLENFALYWYFVELVWLVIFVILYCI